MRVCEHVLSETCRDGVSRIQRPHKDNNPTSGPQNQNVGSLCLCGLCPEDRNGVEWSSPGSEDKLGDLIYTGSRLQVHK